MPTLNEEDEEERDGFLAARRPLDREGALLLEEDLDPFEEVDIVSNSACLRTKGGMIESVAAVHVTQPSTPTTEFY